MSSKRKRRKPEQVIRCLAEGESMLAAGKPAAEVYQKFGICLLYTSPSPRDRG